jgi:hypothetical protein
MMMGKFFAGAAFACLLAAALPVRAAEPSPLKPSSPWVVNYAEDSCRLIRTFGEGDRSVRLEFRMFAPGDFFWLLVSGEPIGPTPSGVVSLAYRFDPDEEDVKSVVALRGKIDEKTSAVMFPASLSTAQTRKEERKIFRDDPKAFARNRTDFDPRREAQVDALEIGIYRRPRMILKLGTMRPPMDAVRTCLDDLLVSWGVDAQAQKSLERPPIPTTRPNEWLHPSDYPRRMLAEGRSDQVHFRLTVDTAGMPTACGVLTMEARPEFIKATCDTLMQRARFEPALDANGKPVPSVYVNSVFWLTL